MRVPLPPDETGIERLRLRPGSPPLRSVQLVDADGKPKGLPVEVMPADAEGWAKLSRPLSYEPGDWLEVE